MVRRGNQQRPAFCLILAVTLIVAVGVTIGVLCSHFAGLTWSVRSIELDAHAVQLLADGQAWADAHPQECAALPTGTAIDLLTADAEAPGRIASLRVTAEDADSPQPASRDADNNTPAPRRIVITATVRQGKAASTVRADWRVNPPA